MYTFDYNQLCSTYAASYVCIVSLRRSVDEMIREKHTKQHDSVARVAFRTSRTLQFDDNSTPKSLMIIIAKWVGFIVP